MQTRADSSARERAYDHILGRILGGEWPGGTIVSELALSKELGVSRTPVREAVRQLTGEGFLEESPNRGLAVATISRNDIAELYELREAIEVFAVGKAACVRLSASDRDRLQGILADIDALRESLEKSGEARLDVAAMQRFIQADLNFHTMLLHAAANRRMLKLVNETRLLIRIFSIHRGGHSAQQLRQIQDQHQAILNSVLLGHGDEAKEILSAHIRLSGQERMEAFDEWERERSLDQLSRIG